MLLWSVQYNFDSELIILYSHFDLIHLLLQSSSWEKYRNQLFEINFKVCIWYKSFIGFKAEQILVSIHFYLKRECSLVQGMPAKQTYGELHAIHIIFFSFFRNPTKRAYSTVFKTWTIIMNKLFPLCTTCFLNYMVILIYIRFVNYKMGTQ